MGNIERIELMASGPDVPRATWADMPEQYMTLLVVRVTDTDGATGIGAAQSYSSYGFDLSAYEGSRALAPRIIGKEAFNREARWRDLQTLVCPAPLGSVSALDIALWDLSARVAGVPLYQYVGGAQSSIEAYASTPQLNDVSDYLALVSELAQLGYRAVKFHAWNDPVRDLEMLRAVHREYGATGITLMHDAENRYDMHSAVSVARELEEMNYRWLEAPFIDYDVDSYRRLRELVSLPIIPHGIWISDIHALAHALKSRPWDAVRIDATAVGGLTPSLKICALAEGFGLSVEVQSWGYTLIQAPNLHLGLGTGRSSYFESPIPYKAHEFGVLDPIRPRSDGRVYAPDGNGLGLTVDWEAIEAAAMARSTVTR